MATKIKKGSRVQTSGKGRTADWVFPHKGTVIRRKGNSVFVHWDYMTFLGEDEMSLNEVKLIRKK